MIGQPTQKMVKTKATLENSDHPQNDSPLLTDYLWAIEWPRNFFATAYLQAIEIPQISLEGEICVSKL